MCSRKDIDIILDQFQRCTDQEEKRKILHQIDTCSTCSEKSHGAGHDATRCGCGEFQRVEFLNLIEHIKQQSILKKKSD